MKIDRGMVSKFLGKLGRAGRLGSMGCSDLAEELCSYIEKNPSCVVVGKKRGKYRYGTVGYGIFGRLGEKYRAGRIEIYSRSRAPGTDMGEGSYYLPNEVADDFENFVGSMGTDLPISISVGSPEKCRSACAHALTREKKGGTSPSSVAPKRPAARGLLPGARSGRR